jgi:hypothetical protein
MPLPGEHAPRNRRWRASRVQTQASNEAARQATMSQAGHQSRTFRAMPAFWSFGLVSLRLRKSECSIVESLMLGYLARRLKLKRWVVNMKFFINRISLYFQDRSDALSLTGSATAVTCLLQMSRNPRERAAACYAPASLLK